MNSRTMADYRHLDRGSVSQAVLIRFESHLSRSDEGCWLYSPQKSNGYAYFHHGAIRHVAHRWAYEFYTGNRIPGGLTLDHLCFTKNCVNPDHLEPVTLAENIRRAKARQTHCAAGHPLIERDSRGDRICRICRREYQREYMRNWRTQRRQSP